MISANVWKSRSSIALRILSVLVGTEYSARYWGGGMDTGRIVLGVSVGVEENPFLKESVRERISLGENQCERESALERISAGENQCGRDSAWERSNAGENQYGKQSWVRVSVVENLCERINVGYSMWGRISMGEH